MNKAQLAKSIKNRSQYNVSQAVVEDVINALVETIIEQVSVGDTVQLIGFGTFSKCHHSERKCKNPRTGEEMTIPDKYVPKFTAGKTFKEALK